MIDEKEYLFASSFLKAADSKGSARERLTRFTEAGSTQALIAAMCEVFRLQVKGGESFAAICDEAVSDAVEKLRGALPDFSVIAPLLYKYDCTNVKTAIKAAARGIALTDDMLFHCGSVPAQSVLSGAENGSFTALPPAMDKASRDARDTFRATGEVRAIDLIMDKACFEDMKNKAAEAGEALIIKIASMRADSVNILASARIASSGMPAETQKSLFERAFVNGGELNSTAFISEDGGCRSIKEISERAGAFSLSDALHKAANQTGGISGAEKLFDEAVLGECDKYRFKPFGAEVSVRYLLVRESEVANARIIDAGIKSGQSPESYQERLREAYV